MIRVLLAEDQAMVRGALAALLALQGDIEIIAEVGRGDEVATVALATKPDVALLDIEMPGCDVYRLAKSCTGTRCPRALRWCALECCHPRRYRRPA